MTSEIEPLAIVRESRIRMSRAAGNDPRRLVAELRKLEVSYAAQIDNYQRSHRRVAEDCADYGDEKAKP